MTGLAGACAENERSSPPVAAPSRLAALTGVRFVAACHVVVFHMLSRRLGVGDGVIGNIVGSGYIGVDLFFILSGFILTYTYYGAGDRGQLRLWPFYVARLARVYPVYVLGLLISLPFFLARGHQEGLAPAALSAAAAQTVLLVQAWRVPPLTLWNGPGWSLSVELLFYVSFPFLIRWLRNVRPDRVAAVGLAAWAGALLPPLWYVVLQPDGHAIDVHAEVFWLSTIKFNPLLHLPEFVLGAVAGRWFLTQDPVARSRCTRHGGSIAMVTTAGVVLVLAFADRIPFVLLHNGLLAPIFAILIVALATGDGLLARVLAHRWTVRLGEASYALYILHMPLSDWHDAARRVLPLRRLPLWLDAAGYAAVVIGVALLAFTYVEEPARNWLRRALGGRRAGPRVRSALGAARETAS